MPVVSISKREFTRLEVLLKVQSGRLRVADACALLDSASDHLSSVAWVCGHDHQNGDDQGPEIFYYRPR